jgi:SAM-dependent methyltransferase
MNFQNINTLFQFEGDLSYYLKTYGQLNDYNFQAKLIKILLKKRNIKLKEASILDLGCGCGDLFLYLQDVKNLIGIDKSKKLIGIAKQRGIKNARFICLDFLKWKPKEYFDVIFISQFLAQTFPSEYALKTFLYKIQLWLNNRGCVIFDWLDDEVYSKIFKDGESERIVLKNKYSFQVFTKKINNQKNNQKRFFQLTFYKNNKKVLSGKAIYLCLPIRSLIKIIQTIGFNVEILNDDGLSYKKWFFLFR